MKPPEFPKDFLVVPAAEVEEGSIWVCSDLTTRRDSLEANCAECGVKVYHRPHAPAQTKKICLKCALALMDEASLAGAPITPAVTSETAVELKQDLVDYEAARKVKGRGN